MPIYLVACPSCSRHIRLTEARCPFCGVTCPESLASSPAPVPPPRGLSRAGLLRFNVLAAAGMVGGSAAYATVLTSGCGGIASTGMSTSIDTSTSTGTPISTTTDTRADTQTDTYTMVGTATAYGLPPALPNCGPNEIPDGGVAVPGVCSGNEYVLLPGPLGTEVPSPSWSACSPGVVQDCASGGDAACLVDCRSFLYAICSHASYSVCSASLPGDGGGWVQVVLPDGGPIDASDASMPGDAGDGR
jgi:hypothetical protein